MKSHSTNLLSTTKRLVSHGGSRQVLTREPAGNHGSSQSAWRLEQSPATVTKSGRQAKCPAAHSSRRVRHYFCPRVSCKISSVEGPSAATPLALRRRSSINALNLAAGRIRAPPWDSSNTTSVLGSSPRRSRRLTGIVTWPLELIRIFGFLRFKFLNYRFESSMVGPADRILGLSLDLGATDITTAIGLHSQATSPARSRPEERHRHR